MGSTSNTRKRPLAESDSNVAIEAAGPAKKATKTAAKTAAKTVAPIPRTVTPIPPPQVPTAAAAPVATPGTTPKAAPSAAPDVAPAVAPPAAETAAATAAPPATAPATAPPKYRASRGPQGEHFLPYVMPKESQSKIKSLLIPGSWVYAIDATPDRGMTLGCRQWWEDFGDWVDQHKSKLGMRAAEVTKWQAKTMQLPLVGQADKPQDDWDFLCLPVPKSREMDDDDEDDEDDEEADEEEEAGDEGEGPKKTNPAGKLASLFSDHPATVSALGNDRSRWWMLEILKRDPDDFGLYMYNDFAAYGQVEVLRNIIKQFSIVSKSRPPPGVRQVWPEIEGLAIIAKAGVFQFQMIDDPDSVARVLKMLGFMIIAGVEYIDSHFGPLQEQVPNMGYIFAQLIQWAFELSDYWEKEVAWAHWLVKRATDAGVPLVGVPRIASILNSMKKTKVTAKQLASWSNVDFDKKWKNFKDVPGHAYDITLMSAAERKRRSQCF